MNTRIAASVMSIFAILPFTLMFLRLFEFARTAPMDVTLISIYAGLMVLGAVASGACYAFCAKRSVVLHLLLALNCIYGIFGLIAVGQLVSA